LQNARFNLLVILTAVFICLLVATVAILTNGTKPVYYVICRSACEKRSACTGTTLHWNRYHVCLRCRFRSFHIVPVSWQVVF